MTLGGLRDPSAPRKMFPVFFFDSNSGFGLIDSWTRVEWLIEVFMEGLHSGAGATREEAIEHMLNGKIGARSPRLVS